jgi:hypothetical protein
MMLTELRVSLGQMVRVLNIQDAQWDIPTEEARIIYGREAVLISSGVCEGQIIGYEVDNSILDMVVVKVRSRRTNQVYEISDLSQLELIET